MSTQVSPDQPGRWHASAYERQSDFRTLIERSTELFSTRIFIRPAESGVEPVSFADLQRFVDGFEVYLAQNGVGPRERCAVIAQNNTSLALIFIAMLATGRQFVPLNPNSSIDEINFIIDDCAPAALLFEAALEEKGDFVQERCEMLPIADSQEFIETISKLSALPPGRRYRPAPEDIAEIVYTSGTTGRPKGVLLSQRNLMADLFGIGRLFGFSPDDRFLTVTPLFHNSGQITTTLIPLYCGASTTVIRPDMGFLNFWHYVDRFRPSWSLVMPSHITLMLDREEKPTAATLKGILCGGAKLPNDSHDAFELRFGVPIYPNYGLTESTSIATCVGPDDENRSSGSVGRPISINEVKIFREGRETRRSEVGDIQIKGDNVFVGYLNRDELTAERVQRGWLHTGDLGYFDDAGCVHIVDRTDNMIIVGGENVYPSDVERLVPGLPGLSEGVLLSIPERIMGRELVLLYRLAPGKTADVRGWKTRLHSSLTSFKVPRRFVEVRDLGMIDFPRSQSGKILRAELQDLLEREFCTAAVTTSGKTPANAHRRFAPVAQVLAQVLDVSVDTIGEDFGKDLVSQWDSIAHLQLVLALEQEFGVVFGPTQIVRMMSIRAIVEILDEVAPK